VGRERSITVKNVAHPKKITFVALGALAIMLAVSGPSHAAGAGGHAEGGHGGGAGGHHGFEGHHFEGHEFEGRHFEGRHFEGHEFERRHFEGPDFGFGFGPVFPYDEPYYVAPSYWYYCPSYRAYYPSVTSCPEAWVPVPQ
jgi:hypothetical protein